MIKLSLMIINLLQRKATSAYVYVCPRVHACMCIHKDGNYYVCSWLCAMYYIMTTDTTVQ